MNQRHEIKYLQDRIFSLCCTILLGSALFLLPFILNGVVEAAIPQQDMTIEYRSGKVSVIIKGVEVKKALQEIAQKTGIEFVGLDGVTGVIEGLEFRDLPLEEAIRAMGQNSIMIFRKEGPEEGTMNIKKVIILAQKEEEKREQVPPPTPPAPPERPATPPPAPPTPPPPPPRSVPPPPKPAPQPERPAPPVAPPAPPKPAPQPAVKPAPKAAEEDSLAKGLKYFETKRWDLAAKYLKMYIGSHPGDADIQEKIAQSTQNAEAAIKLYKSARASEDAGDLQKALDIYKTSYDIYPLLYDTWERMQALKKKAR